MIDVCLKYLFIIVKTITRLWKSILDLFKIQIQLQLYLRI